MALGGKEQTSLDFSEDIRTSASVNSEELTDNEPLKFPHEEKEPLFSQSGNLYPTPPFDMRQSMAYLGFTMDDSLSDRKALMKALSINQQAILFQVSAVGTIEKPLLSYILHSEKAISQNTRNLALDRIRFFLSLNDDLNTFYRIGNSDPHFQPIIHRLYGYHQVKFLTPFESACWALLTGKVPIAEARLAKRRLMRYYGRKVPFGNRHYFAFPEAGDLAFTPLGELTSTLFDETAAACLLAAARAFHEADDEFLMKAPFDEVSDWLQRLPGLNAWAAAFILLQGLGRMERAPITDKRLSP
ncbi:MAG: hypothetical protein AAFP70_14330 [Calditrichota bacterium]